MSSQRSDVSALLSQETEDLLNNFNNAEEAGLCAEDFESFESDTTVLPEQDRDDKVDRAGMWMSCPVMQQSDYPSDLQQGFKKELEKTFFEEPLNMKIKCENEKAVVAAGTNPQVNYNPVSTNAPLQTIKNIVGLFPAICSQLAPQIGSQVAPQICTQVAPQPVCVVSFEDNFELDISIQAVKNLTKACKWTYSEVLKKLFVRYAVSCPIGLKITRQNDYVSLKTDSGSLNTNNSGSLNTNNSVSLKTDPGLLKTDRGATTYYLRACPVFTQSQFASTAVRRCHYHTTVHEYNEGHPAPSHLVRCASPSAYYEEDPVTGFKSVVSTIDIPDSSTVHNAMVSYQFMCMSSCAGGLNRRAINVVFTLERPINNILASKALDVRICSCPGRDHKVAEKQYLERVPVSKQEVPPTDETQPLTIDEGTESNQELPASNARDSCSKKRRMEDGSAELQSNKNWFTLKIYGRKNYETLSKLSNSMQLADALSQPQIDGLVRQKGLCLNLDSELRSSDVDKTSNAAALDVDEVDEVEEDDTRGSDSHSRTTDEPLNEKSFFFDVTPQPGKLSEKLKARDGSIVGEERVVSSSQLSDSHSPVTVEAAEALCTFHQQNPKFDSWLKENGLGACSSILRKNNLTSISNLENMSFKRLKAMGLTKEEMKRLWQAVPLLSEEDSQF